ncbi:hypothetical protein GCM10027589_08820 [Actinocorallia lasiicapitis]
MSASPISDPSGLSWRTSTYTNANNNDCVELAATTNTIHIRDTKNRDAATLRLHKGAMRSFIARLKSA